MRNKIARAIWNTVWLLLFRPTPRFMFSWRRLLLRGFGARLANPVYIYSSVRIWAPWNLQMGAYSALGERVNCYCVDKVRIGNYTTVSQFSFICSASHDYTVASILHNPCIPMPLTTAPIALGDHVWIAADVFLAPGITIGSGTVVFARSSVFNDLPAWVVAAGYPASPIKKRILKTNDENIPPTKY
jgi:putative colanic acid biosynthesis acetyltransferase WcaF